MCLLQDLKAEMPDDHPLSLNSTSKWHTFFKVTRCKKLCHPAPCTGGSQQNQAAPASVAGIAAPVGACVMEGITWDGL
jgi:hypothetical protein